MLSFSISTETGGISWNSRDDPGARAQRTRGARDLTSPNWRLTLGCFKAEIRMLSRLAMKRASPAGREDQAATSGSWICPTCVELRDTRFCSQCGEERLRPNDLTARDMIAQIAKSFSSIDGRLFRSYRSVLSAPGALTAAHVGGQRRSFLGPFALFFVANALFVAVQTVTGTNILSSPLDSHLNNQDWSSLARTMVEQRLASRGTDLAAYRPIFDRGAIFNAKAGMIVMVLAFAPLLFPTFRSRHRPAGAHLVFALHLYAFVLTLLCVSLLISTADRLIGGQGLSSPAVDLALSLFNVGACSIYIFLAIGRAYGASGVSRWIKTAWLASAVAALFVGYRFAIFLITFYTT